MPPANPKYILEHKKKVVEVKRILLDPLKDRMVPHITKKNTTKEMYDVLGTLYYSVHVSRNMLLKNKLNTTYMSKTYTITS